MQTSPVLWAGPWCRAFTAPSALDTRAASSSFGPRQRGASFIPPTMATKRLADGDGPSLKKLLEHCDQAGVGDEFRAELARIERSRKGTSKKKADRDRLRQRAMRFLTEDPTVKTFVASVETEDDDVDEAAVSAAAEANLLGPLRDLGEVVPGRELTREEARAAATSQTCATV